MSQGEVFNDSGLSIVLTNTSHQMTIEPRYSRGPWVIAHLHVSNTGDHPAFFAPMLQQLFIQGREYASTPSAAEDIDGDTASAASLSVGDEADVVLAFNVSGVDVASFAGAPPELVVRGSDTSPGVSVAMRTS